MCYRKNAKTEGYFPKIIFLISIRDYCPAVQTIAGRIILHNFPQLLCSNRLQVASFISDYNRFVLKEILGVSPLPNIMLFNRIYRLFIKTT